MPSLKKALVAALVHTPFLLSHAIPDIHGEKIYPEGYELPQPTSTATRRVIAVPKLAEYLDSEAKYFMDYIYDTLSPAGQQHDRQSEYQQPDIAKTGNSTSYSAPIILHSSWTQHRYDVLSLFKRQNFQCPTGTQACTGIPNGSGYCCKTTETCETVVDVGAGAVGCCPNGATCSGTVTACSAGYSTCPRSFGGGCCIPGYTCTANGCVPNAPTQLTSTTVITIQPTVIVVQGTAKTTTTPCPVNYNECPATLAGGCCRIDRACGVSNCPVLTGATTTTTNNVIVTVQPTNTALGCPGGYYLCAADVNYGCCRSGRTCALTNCPATGTGILAPGGGGGATGNDVKVSATGGTAVVTNNVLPATACPAGFNSCAPSLNGGCCPTGYDCGVSNCPVVGITGTAGIVGGGVGVAATKVPAGTGAAGRSLEGLREVMLIWGVGIAVGVLLGIWR